jgi:hypothetical protein
MDRSTRRRALDAAARVAFSLSVFGCSTTGLTIEESSTADPARPKDGPDGVAPPDVGGQGGTSSSTTTTVDATSSGGASGEASVVEDDVQRPADADLPLDGSTPEVDAPTLACNAPPVPEDLDASMPAIPSEVAACCMDYAAQRVPDGGYFFSEEDRKDPNLIACCAVVIATQTRLWGLPYGHPCCAAAPIFVRAPQFMACTPWGPPVPPAMPRELAEEKVIA